MKVKAINLLNAYGDEVRVISRAYLDTRMGGKRMIMELAAPPGYLRPKRIVYFPDMKPVLTDSFVMMNPTHVDAPGIDGVKGACKRNLREASQAVYSGGGNLARFIDWENPFEMRQDRGWFPITDPAKFLNFLSNTGAMISVPGTLHNSHETGFKLVESFKTVHRVPTFQVTLWQCKDEWAAEIDIDAKKGISHWGEVIRNHLTGGKTNPYLVNQLLAWYWGIVSFKLEISADKPG